MNTNNPNPAVMPLSEEKLLEAYRLALAANGGDEFWKISLCGCDYETNQVPCRYCAIHVGLTKLKQALDRERELRQEAEGANKVANAIIGDQANKNDELVRSLNQQLHSAQLSAEGMKTVLESLLKKLEIVHANPAYQAVWILSQNHSGPYTGPSYDEEMMNAHEALSSTPAPDQFVEKVGRCTCEISRGVTNLWFWEVFPLKGGGHTSFGLHRCDNCGKVSGFPDSNLDIALECGTEEAKAALAAQLNIKEEEKCSA